MRGRDDRRAAGAREGRGRRARDVGLLGRRALRLLRLAPRQCGGGRGAEARESGLRDPPTVAAGSHWGGERTRELGPRLGSARTDGAGAGGKQGGRRGLWAAPGARSRGCPSTHWARLSPRPRPLARCESPRRSPPSPPPSSPPPSRTRPPLTPGNQRGLRGVVASSLIPTLRPEDPSSVGEKGRVGGERPGRAESPRVLGPGRCRRGLL